MPAVNNANVYSNNSNNTFISTNNITATSQNPTSTQRRQEYISNQQLNNQRTIIHSDSNNHHSKDHPSSMEYTSLTNIYIKKGYVQRDYSKGTKIRFETTLPTELENIISEQEFVDFIEALNEIYLDSEKLKFCEGCMACLTAYLLYCCIETHKQKCMRKAADFLAKQNELWRDRGITVLDPITRGFRILEIQVTPNMHQTHHSQQQLQPNN